MPDETSTSTCPYRVVINGTRCKTCGICVGFCPMKGLLIAGGELRHTGSCRGCRLCELHCPDLGIGIERQDERQQDA